MVKKEYFNIFSPYFPPNICYLYEVIEGSNDRKQKAVAHLRRYLAKLLKSWTSLDQNSIKMIYKASQPISLIEQLQHPFRVRNFWDRLIPNCGCHYGYVSLSHLGVVTCVMGVETATGFINRCHYRSFLRQTCRKLGRIKMTSTCL